jgi:hypothetical protein
MTVRLAELLAELSARGVTLAPEGTYLSVTPRSALTPDLLARIRDLKSEILAELAAPAARPFHFPTATVTPAERAALVAIAVHPGLRLPDLAATTHLQRTTLDRALATLRRRREIAIAADGTCHLLVH